MHGWRRCGRQRLSPRRAKELSTSPPTSSGMALPKVVLRASLDGRTEEVVADSAPAKVKLKVPSVELWWPVGRGSQRLYSLVVETLVDGTPTDRVERRIGFRTVELDTSAETDGTRFALVVNGERIWVRGFN